MSYIKPYQDLETQKQYRNHTQTQKKNISELKEGVVVNNLIKDRDMFSASLTADIDNMYDNLVIPDKTVKPDTFETKDKKNNKEKSLQRSLAPLLATTVGVFGVIAGSMFALRKSAEIKKNLKPWQTLQEVTKHVSVNDEPHLAMLLMIRDPNYRNVMGALGVFVLSSIGFVAKNFVDGVKEIWVRKKQADVQRNLQEQLIEVETKSFSGKMQILRNMLAEKAKELNSVLHKNNVGNENTTFKKFISFKNSHTAASEVNAKEKRNTLVAAAAVGFSSVIAAILALLAMKNLHVAAKTCEDIASTTLKEFGQSVSKIENPSQGILEKLKNRIVSLNLNKRELDDFFKDLKNLPEGEYTSINGDTYKSYKEYVTREVEKLTDEGAEAIAGKPSNKPVLFSYTGDLCSHLYNMIVNPHSPLLKMVFGGMAAVTTVGYVGAKTVEAVKEAEVIKENAKTELDLQKRLVSVELKNFETKKRSVIEPLMDEFRVQAMNGKDKAELKTRAENILYEIKNGPPFVYS